VRLGGVRIAIVASGQKPERHERVEEVSCRAGVQAKTSADRVEVFRATREFAEHTYLDSAQERLRSPERESRLQDLFGSCLPVHSFSASLLPRTLETKLIMLSLVPQICHDCSGLLCRERPQRLKTIATRCGTDLAGPAGSSPSACRAGIAQL